MRRPLFFVYFKTKRVKTASYRLLHVRGLHRLSVHPQKRCEENDEWMYYY